MPINNQTRIQGLAQRHKQLEQQINIEEKRPSPDTLRLYELKRQKLRLKEEIDSLEPP